MERLQKRIRTRLKIEKNIKKSLQNDNETLDTNSNKMSNQSES